MKRKQSMNSAAKMKPTIDDDICYLCGFPVTDKQESEYYGGPFKVHKQCLEVHNDLIKGEKNEF